MIPNMFKIAGELLPTVFHVTARTVATHALSIFGDHSDIMACRSTGWAMLGVGQRAGGDGFRADLAGGHAALADCRSCISSTASAPRMKFPKIEMLDEEVMRALIDDKLIAEHRARAHDAGPAVLRGTAQNPDVFFQGARGVQSVLRRVPGHRAEGDGRVRRA